MFKRNGSFGGAGGGKKFGGKKFGDRAPFGGRDSRGGNFVDRDNARPQLHKAACAGCNEQCTVPFKPNGSKPIYCHNCFRKDGDRRTERFEKRSFGEKRAYGRVEVAEKKNDGLVEKRLDEVNMKLDRILREIETIKEMNG